SPSNRNNGRDSIRVPYGGNWLALSDPPGGTAITLFPLAGGGRRKPTDFVFAPVRLCPYPSILEKSATVRVATRIWLRSLSRLARAGASSTLTVTSSK